MLAGRFAASSVARFYAPQVVSIRSHTEGSKFYAQKKELEAKILELEKEIRPKPYTRDATVVDFVSKAQQSIEKSSKTLSE